MNALLDYRAFELSKDAQRLKQRAPSRGRRVDRLQFEYKSSTLHAATTSIFLRMAVLRQPIEGRPLLSSFRAADGVIYEFFNKYASPAP